MSHPFAAAGKIAGSHNRFAAMLDYRIKNPFIVSSDHHIIEARTLLANGVRMLYPEPRVTIEAPATVQAVVTDNPAQRRLRVHLLGYNAPPQTTPATNRPYVLPVPIEDTPLYRTTITLRDPPKRVSACSSSTKVTSNGTRVRLVVEDIHEVIVVDY